MNFISIGISIIAIIIAFLSYKAALYPHRYKLYTDIVTFVEELYSGRIRSEHKAKLYIQHIKWLYNSDEKLISVLEQLNEIINANKDDKASLKLALIENGYIESGTSGIIKENFHEPFDQYLCQ